jgi:hypothetical protein
MKTSHKLLISALFFILLVLAVNGTINSFMKKSLEIELASPQNDTWQVFYDLGQGYNEKDSSTARLKKSGAAKIISFDLIDRNINSLRIDPGVHAGNIQIRSITYRVGKSSRIWSAKEISGEFRPLNQISSFIEDKGILRIKSTGRDPYFEYSGDFSKIDEGLSGRYARMRSILYLLGLFLAAGIFSFFEKLVGYAKAIMSFMLKQKEAPYFAVFRKRMDIIGGRISEERLLIFDHKVLILLFIIFTAFILSVSFKLNGSSAPVWGRYITQSNAEGSSFGLLLGHPKRARSDEWGEETPWILSQAVHGYNVRNDNVGYGESTLLANLPVKHYTTLFRPQFYGFFIFHDVDLAFSFIWNYKVFGLFLSVFFLLMLLNENDFWLSVFGAAWLYFSSFVQWLFSLTQAMPEMITAFCVIFIAVNYLMFSFKKANIIFSAVILVAYSINFTMIFYPPFQLPLAYLLVFLIVGYVLRKRQNGELFDSGHFGLKAFMAAGVLLSLIVFACAFFFETRDTMMNMLNTAYPGVRRVFGGGLSVRTFFSGFYNSMFSEGDFPRISRHGVCEASNFILLFPFILVFYFKENFLKKSDPVMISLMLYLLFLSAWILFGLPSFLAGKILLTLVTSNRAFIGIGIASIILTTMFLKIPGRGAWADPSRRYILFLIFFLLMLFHGILLNRVDPFYNTGRILFISTWFAAALLFLYYRKRLLFALFVLVLLFPNVLINPIVSGLSVFRAFPIIQYVKMIDKGEHNKWLVYGNPVMLPDYFKAAGLDVFNGFCFAPGPDKMRSLDPRGKNKNIYNRLAYMTAVPSNGDMITFKLLQNDYYEVTINPISRELKELGIKYLILPSNPGYLGRYHFDIEKAKRNGLIVMNKEPINGFWVCTFKKDGK